KLSVSTMSVSDLIASASFFIAALSLYMSYRNSSFEKKAMLSRRHLELTTKLYNVMSKQRELDRKLFSLELEYGSSEELEHIKKKAALVRLKDDRQLRSGDNPEMLVIDEKLNSVAILSDLVSKLVQETEELSQSYKRI
ncbi:TPA: hypothetical protein ACMDS1_004704, partial [Vibrio parahaemolyticus]